jgi:hypothetical protein
MAVTLSVNMKTEVLNRLDTELDTIELLDDSDVAVDASQTANHGVSGSSLTSTAGVSWTFEITYDDTTITVSTVRLSKSTDSAVYIDIPLDTPYDFTANGYYTVTSYSVSL